VPESALLETRAHDVQAIERHINDLSQLFSRLAVVVAEQASLVERIEDNTTDALSNMEAGQAQLARYWERVSSNRGLVMRVASTLVVSAVLFALFGT
jgi:syntaxin 5